MTTAVDYLDRKFDVLAFAGASPRTAVLLQQSLFRAGTSGEVCTGVQKLAQRWALEFLTIRGSMPFHMQSRGSDFLRWVRQGRLQTEYDVRAYFNFAAQQVSTNLLNEEVATMHPEDRFDRASLLQLQLHGTSLALVVNVRSLAGDNRQVILPIHITPANLRL